MRKDVHFIQITPFRFLSKISFPDIGTMIISAFIGLYLLLSAYIFLYLPLSAFFRFYLFRFFIGCPVGINRLQFR